MELFTTLNTFVGWGALALQVLAALLIIAYVKRQSQIGSIVAAAAIPLGFALSLAATIMSLVYSEYFGVEPCGFCWLQRVFLYPQVVLFAVAYLARDARVYLYSLWLSALGAAVALYQHYLQMGGTGVLPCPAAGTADCAKRIIFEMGYITFPLVSLTVFAFLIVLMLYLRRAYRDSTTASY